MLEAMLTASDGTRLYTRRWATPSPIGEAVIAHGLSEHSGRYLHVAEALVAAGWAVTSYDHRGFGQSAGRRAHVRRFAEFPADLGTVLAHARVPGLPLALVAHSMGGLIATLYCESGQEPQPDLLVLSGPAIDPRAADTVPRRKILLGRLLSRTIPTAKIRNDDEPGAESKLSRDPAVHAAFDVDELRVRHVTARFGVELIAALHAAWAGLDRLTVPVLFVHGEEDEIVPVGATRDGAPRAGSTDVTVRIYADMRHEVFNEVGKEAVLTGVTSWLAARVPAATPRAGGSGGRRAEATAERTRQWRKTTRRSQG